MSRILALSILLWSCSGFAALPEVGVRWTHRASSWSGAPLALTRLADGSIRFVPNCSDLQLRGLSGDGRDLGTVRLQRTNETEMLFTAVLDPFGDVFAAAYGATPPFSTLIRRHDGHTGLPVWTSPIALSTQDLRLSPAGTLVATSSAGILAVDTQTGRTLWGPVSFPDGYQADDFLFDARGNVIVTGLSYPDRYSYVGVPFLLAVDGVTGRIAWGPIEPPLPPGGRAAPGGLVTAVDPAGDVVVARRSLTAGGTDVALTRLARESGAVVWSVVTPDSGILDGPSRMLLDDRDGLFLCATSLGPRERDGLTTSRYDASTGARVWGPILHPASAGLTPIAFALDARGHLVTSAFSPESALVTFADDARDGRAAWGPTSTGAFVSANGPFFLPHLLPTSDGHLVLPGYVAADSYVGVVVGLDDTSGAPVWRAVVGTPGDVMESRALAVDPKGDLLLLGSSLTKLAGANGAELWKHPDPASKRRTRMDAAGDLLSDIEQNPSGALVEKTSGTTGQRLWEREVTASVYRPDLVVGTNGDAYLHTRGFLERRSGESGDVLWSRSDLPTSSQVGLGILPGGDPMLVTTSTSGVARVVVRRIDATDGRESASYSYDLAGFAYGQVALAPAPDDRAVIAAQTRAGFALFSIDARNGTLLWGPVRSECSVGDDLSYSGYTFPVLLVEGTGDVVFANNSMCADGSGTWVMRLDGRTGARRWGPVRLPDAIFGEPALTLDVRGDVLAHSFVSYLQSTVRKLDGRTGAVVWSYDVPGTPSAVAAIGTDAVASYNGPNNDYRTQTTLRLTTDLNLQSTTEDLPLGICSVPYLTALRATGATSPRSFHLASGSLPPGVTLTSSTGELSGIPASTGDFAFRVAVVDGAGKTASRDLVLGVRPAMAPVSILATAGIGATSTVVLSVAGSFTSYRWLPGEETTPTITISPNAATTYGVVVSDGGCERRGSILVPARAPEPVLGASSAYGFFTVVPCRVLDTRVQGARLAAGELRDVDVAGRCGIPASARAIVANVTAVEPSQSGTLEVVASNAEIPPPPGVVSFRPGTTRAAFALLQLGADGRLSVACDMLSGSTDLVLDVSGYFQ